MIIDTIYSNFELLDNKSLDSIEKLENEEIMGI